jgi:hypothetical protein
MGLAGGSAIGLWVRTHELLSPHPAVTVGRWTSAGLDKPEAARLLFPRVYGGDAPAKETDSSTKTEGDTDKDKGSKEPGEQTASTATGGLMTGRINDICTDLAGKDTKKRRAELKALDNPRYSRFEKRCIDDESFNAFIEDIVCGKK